MTDSNFYLNSLDASSRDDFMFETALRELDELISRVGPLTDNRINFLLNYWRRFSIYQIEPFFSGKKDEDEQDGGSGQSSQTIPQIIRIPGGWKVLDYGDGLITSSGENYGSYSTGPLLKTVKYMVGCLAKRGAKVVAFSGALPAKRLAWLECMHYGIDNRFSPNTQDLKCREGLTKLLKR
jgi:hypothetical protein